MHPPARRSFGLILAAAALITAAHPALASDSRRELANRLRTLLDEQPHGMAGFTMPPAGDLAALPQHPLNPVTKAKVRLGQLLFHETAVGTESADERRRGQYVCASCHNAGAGFKPGIPQGIADGGSGFGRHGRDRVMLDGMNASLPDGDPDKPDVQPIAVPTNLNSAYQDVALWNGELGSSTTGANAGLDIGGGPSGLRVNEFGLPGLETQVLAGTRVHRLRFDDGSVLQTLRRYRTLYEAAFPNGDTGFIPADSDVSPEALGAAKAIAAYERTLLATKAPFQRWLRSRGRGSAMSVEQLRGAIVFFDSERANCVACHTGPALSTRPGAPADTVFRAVGFPDFDTSDPRIHGSVPQAARLGRGGFTNRTADNYRFKIPQLYNLEDSKFLGHGSSFNRIGQVVRYKNLGVPATDTEGNLDPLFVPLGLDRQEIGDLIAFIKHGLRDPDLARYVPKRLPSGNCFPVADLIAVLELDC